METLPAVYGGAAETLAAAEEQAAKAKRARKRSRYLSSDYDTAILIDDDHSDQDIAAASPRKGEDAAALLLGLQQDNLAVADLHAALLRSAASPGGESFKLGPGGVDAGVLLRFFALHRASLLAAKDPVVPAAVPDGHGQPNPCRAMVAVAADGSAGKKQDDVYSAMVHALDAFNASAAAVHSAQPAAVYSAQPAANSAVGQAYGQHSGPAVAAPATGRKRGRKKVALALDAHNAAGSSAQPATGIANGFNSAPKKAKKARRNSVQGQQPGKPVALILDFGSGGTAAIHRPSKEDLLSTFRGFGSLIESDTDIGTRHARLVFESSAAAEAAYRCAHTLGNFSNRRLQYLRPPPQAPKIPLADMRKNLERMILSLTGPSLVGGEGSLDLAEQMLRLMAKVDKKLYAAGAPGPSTAAAAHHRY